MPSDRMRAAVRSAPLALRSAHAAAPWRSTWRHLSAHRLHAPSPRLAWSSSARGRVRWSPHGRAAREGTVALTYVIRYVIRPAARGGSLSSRTGHAAGLRIPRARSRRGRSARARS
jgi:hypothetical protein